VKLTWNLKAGESIDGGVRVTSASRAGYGDRRKWLAVHGGGGIQAEFEVDHIPAWCKLELNYLSTGAPGPDGKRIHFTPVEIRVNDQLVVTRHTPKRGESLDIVRMIRPGTNQLTVVVHTDARTVLWLNALTVTYGDGLEEDAGEK
jgi:hypothetical protein